MHIAKLIQSKPVKNSSIDESMWTMRSNCLVITIQTQSEMKDVLVYYFPNLNPCLNMVKKVLRHPYNI